MKTLIGKTALTLVRTAQVVCVATLATMWVPVANASITFFL